MKNSIFQKYHLTNKWGLRTTYTEPELSSPHRGIQVPFWKLSFLWLVYQRQYSQITIRKSWKDSPVLFLAHIFKVVYQPLKNNALYRIQHGGKFFFLDLYFFLKNSLSSCIFLSVTRREQRIVCELRGGQWESSERAFKLYVLWASHWEMRRNWRGLNKGMTWYSLPFTRIIELRHGKWTLEQQGY